MRNQVPTRVIAACAGILLASLACRGSAYAAEGIGAKVEDFRLRDVFGNAHSLSLYSGRVVVLAFWAFKCPVSLSYDERLRALQDKYRGSGVTLLAIDSNANESPAEVRANVENLKLAFPVLLDEDGAVAEKLKATHSPSIFVIDGKGVLRYRGAIDNNKKPGENGRISYAEQSIEELVGGRPVSTSETRVFGCNIRRRPY